MLLLLAAQAASFPVAAPAPVALTETHRRDIECVAAFAILANEQKRGVPGSGVYPYVVDRGQTYAGLVGERVMAETGMSREDVRDLIVAAVDAHQREAVESADPESVVEAAVTRCEPLLNAAVPPPAVPDLPQCAAMLQLAYEEVYGREGLSPTAKDLKTLAYVLDSRAREELRAEGFSGNEMDILMTTTREKLLAESKARAAKGQGDNLDFDHCFKLAAPKPKSGVHH